MITHFVGNLLSGAAANNEQQHYKHAGRVKYLPGGAVQGEKGDRRMDTGTGSVMCSASGALVGMQTTVESMFAAGAIVPYFVI